MAAIEAPEIPEPRPGLAGEWDKFIGPGATAAENWLILGSFAAGLILIVWRVIVLDLSWTPWQWLVGLAVSADILAGAVANATTAAKRWYHRPGRTRSHHLRFVAIHLVHLVLLALVFPEMTWAATAVAYVYLLLAAVTIEVVPRYLQRPVAVIAYLGGLMLALYALPLIPGLEWVLPVFYLKLLVAHLVVETPWPATATS
jgi:hypothetical protein